MLKNQHNMEDSPMHGRYGVALAGLVMAGWLPFADRKETTVDVSAPAPAEVRELLEAARGAPALVCALAADALWNGRWGGDGFGDAPFTPVGAETRSQLRRLQRSELTSSEIQAVSQGVVDEDRCVRELSVRLVTRIGEELTTDELLGRFASRTPMHRETATLALGLTRARRAYDALVEGLRDATLEVRANAAWALGRLDERRGAGPLLPVLRDREESVREAAAVALGRLDTTAALSELRRLLRQDSSPRVRKAAAWALGTLRARDAHDDLLASVRQDQDASVREMSAWALGTNHVRSAADALGATLRRDTDENVRETAAWALGNMHERSAADALGDAVGSDRSERVRGTAAWALGQLRSRPAPRSLVEALTDEDQDVRLKAAWALSEIGDSAALGGLRSALRREQHDRTRRALIRALLRSGERSHEALTELLRSSDAETRESAVRALAGGSSGPWPWPWPRPRPVF
jgi:HEAT repeat protein